jgi:hypothetical protein
VLVSCGRIRCPFSCSSLLLALSSTYFYYPYPRTCSRRPFCARRRFMKHTITSAAGRNKIVWIARVARYDARHIKAVWRGEENHFPRDRQDRLPGRDWMNFIKLIPRARYVMERYVILRGTMRVPSNKILDDSRMIMDGFAQVTTRSAFQRALKISATSDLTGETSRSRIEW